MFQLYQARFWKSLVNTLSVWLDSHDNNDIVSWLYQLYSRIYSDNREVIKKLTHESVIFYHLIYFSKLHCRCRCIQITHTYSYNVSDNIQFFANIVFSAIKKQINIISYAHVIIITYYIAYNNKKYL